jgi:hypothetical protein
MEETPSDFPKQRRNGPTGHLRSIWELKLGMGVAELMDRFHLIDVVLIAVKPAF